MGCASVPQAFGIQVRLMAIAGMAEAVSNSVQSAPGLRIDHACGDEFDEFQQFLPVDGALRGFIEGEGFHQVHVVSNPLRLPPANPGSLQRPIAQHILVIPPVQRVGTIFLQQIEGAPGILQGTRISGGKGILRQRIDGKAFPRRSSRHQQ